MAKDDEYDHRQVVGEVKWGRVEVNREKELIYFSQCPVRHEKRYVREKCWRVLRRALKWLHSIMNL